MFAPIPEKPDHDALEQGILDLWARERGYMRIKNNLLGF